MDVSTDHVTARVVTIMQYEVEMKFPVADPAALQSRLAELGAAVWEAQTEGDV